MRILVVSICSLALVSVAVGAQKEQKKSQPKTHAQTAQHATHATGHPAGGGGEPRKYDVRVGRAKAQNESNLNGSVSRPAR